MEGRFGPKNRISSYKGGIVIKWVQIGVLAQGGQGFRCRQKENKSQGIGIPNNGRTKKNKKIAPESLYLKLGSGAMYTNIKILALYNRQRCREGC